MIEQLIRIAAWISQGFNVILLGGHQNRTVSARCYLKKDRRVWGFFYKLINKIFFWQEDHCYQSYKVDYRFAKEVLEEENDKRR